MKVRELRRGYQAALGDKAAALVLLCGLLPILTGDISR